jgi:hypothetical protein
VGSKVNVVVEEMASELLDFFSDPRSGSALHESEARWIVPGGIQRALLQSSQSKPLP